jgi:hypothetical protein
LSSLRSLEVEKFEKFKKSGSMKSDVTFFDFSDF